METVDLTNVKRVLKKLPTHIVTKLRSWARDVELHGLQKVRKTPGYHDEPLKGQRQGKRSIRLSKAYRAIYVLGAKSELTIVEVIEVSKHEY